MKKSRFTESQVVAILKEAFGIRILNAAGFPVPNCHGAHPPTSFNDSGDGSGGCAIPAPDGIPPGSARCLAGFRRRHLFPEQKATPVWR
jgi:hypothetical protein